VIQQPVPHARPKRRWPTALRTRWNRLSATAEAGMSTAEYAVGTVAACAFAAVLYRVVTGGSVVTALGHLVQRALETLA
jgi:glutathione S-transferase